jgi:membrane-bound lytic murein transglycosylase A
MPAPRAIAGVAVSLGLIAGTPAKAVEIHGAQVEKLSFDKLDGWQDDDHIAAFTTYMKSCGAILQADTAARRARPMLGGLYNACTQAKTVEAAGPVDRERARKFFEDNFKPMRILPGVRTYGFYTGADGFFTGYYEAEVIGSRVKTEDYNVPLYGVSPKLAGKKSKVFAQYDRTDIENGALAGKGLEICWIKDPVDAFFAQIQGSTRVKLDDGELLRLNYIASNGKPYTPVGRILIERGVYTPEEMTMDKIREYMEANPDEGKALRLKNRSFVFFSETKLGPQDECIGAQGIPLTPWRSLAVDPSIHVYGTPIWIDAKFPLTGDAPQDTFQHLMFAQDTGSAIKGPARADIYFGHGDDIPHIAGRIKQFGKFVMLVPKDVSVTGIDAPTIPLPKPRPQEISIHEAMAKGREAAPSAAAEGKPAAETASVPAPQPKQRP